MAGVEEAAVSGSHLNGDLDPDDREEGAASTAEEAAKKKRRKKKKSKGATAGKGSHVFLIPARNGRTTWLRLGGGGRDPGPGALAWIIPRPERGARPDSRFPGWGEAASPSARLEGWRGQR